MQRFLLDDVFKNANSSGVVNAYGSWWLWMTKFVKDKPDDFGLLCIEEECTKLRFRCGGSHQFENCAGDVNSTIDLNWRFITKGTVKEELVTGATSRVMCTEIRGIGVHIEYHVRSAISYFGIGMGGHVVKELVYAVTPIFSRQSLLASECR
jgi:hypothetical protein